MLFASTSHHVRWFIALFTALSGATSLAAADTVLFADANGGAGGDGQSWETAYRYLPDALADAAIAEGHVDVLVAQGLYLPDHDEAGAVQLGRRDETFQMINNVSLLGGYAGSLGEDPWLRDIANQPSVLSGDLLQNDVLYFVNVDDNSFHVVTARGTDSTAVLDGFTVRGGSTLGMNGGGLSAYLENGAGVFCWDGSPTLRNCLFRLNQALRGGAIYANGETWYDGQIQYVPVSPTIINCYFTENLSFIYGGAVGLVLSGVTMIDTSFVWNETTGVLGGGALALRDRSIDGSGATIHNSRFIGNFATGGGIGGALRITYVPTEIANTLFLDNSADGDGGALYVEPLTYTIDFNNCTIAGNESVNGNGGGLRVTGFNVSIRNSILWGNMHADPRSFEEWGQIFGPTETVVTASCMEYWSGQFAGGEGNIAEAPLFVDRDGPDDDPDTWTDNDYHIGSGSPCIDAADNSLVSIDVFDLDGDGDFTEAAPFDVDGDARFVDDPDTKDTGVGKAPIVDMGAYEFQVASSCEWDLDGDDFVGTGDLIIMLGSWGDPYGTADLIELLGAWGACP